MIRHLFVYGTLMPGQPRWPALAPWASGGPTQDCIRGQLFDTGYGWPAAVVGAGELIPGFTVAFNPARITEALTALDEIEGTSQGLFRRVPAVTNNLLEVWVYAWVRTSDGFQPISRWA